MTRKFCLALAIALAASAFIGVAAASAAAEFGSPCTANEVMPEDGAISVSHGSSSPLPVAAPVSGVITEWKMTTHFVELDPETNESFAALLGQKLEVFKPAGEGHNTLVGESPSGPVRAIGVSSFPARIPVQAGDFIGLGGTSFTMVCEMAEAADASSVFLGSPTLGSTVETNVPQKELQVPVVAKIEPDVDGDGYGDETQDKCPQSAAYQTPCPVVTISSLPTAGNKAVTLQVTTSLSAPVGVTATVPLAKGKAATLTTADQTVTPGTLTAFTLTLTPQVTKALKALPTKRSLTMSITASATNVTGSPSTTTSTVRLKGQAKPVHKKKKAPRKSGSSKV